MNNTIVLLYKGINVFINKEIILKDVNLTLKSGEVIYLIGDIGSGKTTFLKSLYAEAKIEGEIATVCNFNLLKIKKKEIPYLRRNIGIVFQDFQLLTDRSVYDNLKFVLRVTKFPKKQIDARIEEVLQKVNLLEKKYKMPWELSGGEQQSIVIARAILNTPKLILADEPTGNLDPNSSYNVINLLFELSNNNCAVIIATHNYSLVEKFPSKVYVLQNKQIIELN